MRPVPFALACALFALPVAARAELPKVALPVTAAAPLMDGALDDSWKDASTVTLDTDFTNRRPASEPTEVHIVRDGDALDVAFVAHQRESVIASQQTNSSAVLNDDYVGVYLWPQGTQGFSYAFIANERGARYQSSSENSAYAPQWTAAGKTMDGGYVVTMRIPLGVMRTAGSDSWKVQFVRSVVATNNLDVWTYTSEQNNAADPAFGGTITNFASQLTTRSKPRVQVYALGEATTPGFGGSTSRLGADFSLPITPTASLVASIHPDYSNVEVDQQTIAPSAFAYQYSEVRPFFTQVGQSFNYNFSCSNCPSYLYTPNIPTFRDGYAVEGTQGPISFSGFETVGQSRTDQAQVVNYTKSDDPGYLVTASFQRENVADAFDGLSDDVNLFQTGYENRHSHYFIYTNLATDRGSFVTTPAHANYVESGGGYVTPTLAFGGNYQQIGKQFDPIDGFVSQTDIEGSEYFYRQTLNFATKTILHDVGLNGGFGEYKNAQNERSQEYADLTGTVDFKNLVTVKSFYNEGAVRTQADEFLPFDGSGGLVAYRLNTATPAYVQYTGGPFYHGKLDAWNYVATLQAAPNVHVRLEADEDNYLTHEPGERGGPIWLDRASVDWQLSRDASFDLGVRKLVGSLPPNSFAPPNFATIEGGNLTMAFHLLQQKNEFYVVYGNPNSLSTTPALYVKWIRYIGAPKGT